MRATAKVTRKHQTTIPKEIREVLGLQEGDTVVFEVTEQGVIIRRVAPTDVEYLEAVESTLSEWLSEHDEQAYGDL
jgi:antitoxin PrlF